MSAILPLIAPKLRSLCESDLPAVEALTRACRVFRDAEVRVALEVLGAALGVGRGRDPDYETIGAEVGGTLAGWACWGPVPSTVGTFDLYWIAVAPEYQGHGVGSALLARVEESVAGRARLIVVETAGREEYAATRRFYESHRYAVAARIPDYYELGDDLVTYVKQMSESRKDGKSEMDAFRPSDLPTFRRDS